jgi:hypothetical protein
MYSPAFFFWAKIRTKAILCGGLKKLLQEMHLKMDVVSPEMGAPCPVLRWPGWCGDGHIAAIGDTSGPAAWRWRPTQLHGLYGAT